MFALFNSAQLLKNGRIISVEDLSSIVAYILAKPTSNKRNNKNIVNVESYLTLIMMGTTIPSVIVQMIIVVMKKRIIIITLTIMSVKLDSDDPNWSTIKISYCLKSTSELPSIRQIRYLHKQTTC